jgi:hypothetical protein
VKSSDVDTLQLLVNAANTWRTQALAQNVEIQSMTVEINDRPVSLNWNPGDEENPAEWEVSIP